MNSADGDCDAVPAGGAVRGRGGARLRLGLAGPVGRPHRERVSPGVAGQRHATAPRCRPTPPAASVAACHGPPSTCTSTRLIPRCWAQATPATTTGTGGRAGCAGAGGSIRDCGLDGALRRPAARHPVRVEVGEAWSAPARSPLAGRRRSRRGRARPSAPGSRARPAAARRSSRPRAAAPARRAARPSGCRTSSRRPSGRPAGRRPACGSGLVEQVAERDAEPAGVADQVAADLVGDAGQRDVRAPPSGGRAARRRSTRSGCDQAVDRAAARSAGSTCGTTSAVSIR